MLDLGGVTQRVTPPSLFGAVRVDERRLSSVGSALMGDTFMMLVKHRVTPRIVTFEEPPLPPSVGGAPRVSFRPIGEGRQTQIVAKEQLPVAPNWSTPAKVGWSVRNAFRWAHGIGAKEKHHLADCEDVLALLISHGLATQTRCLTLVDMDTFNKMDIWSKCWWITEPIVISLIGAINQNHREHVMPRRRPVDVIHSALFEN